MGQYKFNPLGKPFDLVDVVPPTPEGVLTLSAEGGALTDPLDNNFDFSSATSGAILFSIPSDGLMKAAVQVDGTTIDVNGSNQLAVITPAGSFLWQQISASQTAVKNIGYQVVSGSVTLTLPSTGSSTVGDRIEVLLIGGAIWNVVYSTGQQIRIGNRVTTISTGSISSNSQGDWLELVYAGGGLWGGCVKQGNLSFI